MLVQYDLTGKTGTEVSDPATAPAQGFTGVDLTRGPLGLTRSFKTTGHSARVPLLLFEIATQSAKQCGEESSSHIFLYPIGGRATHNPTSTFSIRSANRGKLMIW